MNFEDNEYNQYDQGNMYNNLNRNNTGKMYSQGNNTSKDMQGDNYYPSNNTGQNMQGNKYYQSNDTGQNMQGDNYYPSNNTSENMQGDKYYSSNNTSQNMKDNKYYPSNKNSQMSQGSQSKDIRKMHDECERLMNYHSLFTTKDGTKFDGIVLKVEKDYVIILVAEDILTDSDDDVADEKTRQYGYGNPRRFRRFVPREYPYNNIGGVGLLPYPYFVPPYPYTAPLGVPYPFI